MVVEVTDSRPAGQPVGERAAPDWGQALRVTLFVFLVIASLALARDVLRPLALAALIALILSPISKFIEGRGIPRPVAATLTLLAALGIFISAAAVVGVQLAALARDLPKYQGMLDSKLASLVAHDNPMSRAAMSLRRAAEVLLSSNGELARPRVNVAIVGDPLERIVAAAGPYLEAGGIAAIVLVLVLFLLLKRDDMSDRIIRLFGQRKIGLTTRTADEATRRVSRYLAAFTAVNALYGVVIGLGLWAIGVPLAALGGAMAGVLRFVPYVGPAAGFLLPLGLSIVMTPDWQAPVLVVVLYASVAAALVSWIEPVVYGKSTGVSRVALLVSAMFWTWLWGPLGLLLSTPLTVTLAAAASFVPGFGVVATLLREEAGLYDHLRLYRRLLAEDDEGALRLIESAIESSSQAEVFDTMLLPALVKMQFDHSLGEITDKERDHVARAIDDFLDELEWRSDIAVRTYTPGRLSNDSAAAGPLRIEVAGWVRPGSHDGLVLRMLNLLLAPWERSVVLFSAEAGAAPAGAALAQLKPAVVVVSEALDSDRGTSRELGALLQRQARETALVVGRWELLSAAAPALAAAASATPSAGAHSLAEARDQVLAHLQQPAEVVRRTVVALDADDRETADYLFERFRSQHSIEEICALLIEPTLRSIRERRLAGALDEAVSLAQCRFFIDKLREPVTAVRSPSQNAPRALVACPDAAQESVRLMMLTLLLRERGWDVLYVGNTVEIARVGDVAASLQPTVALFSTRGRDTARLRESVDRALERLTGQPPQHSVYFVADDTVALAPDALESGLNLLPDDIRESVRVIEQRGQRRLAA